MLKWQAYIWRSLFLYLFFTLNLWSQVTPFFGPEFTFTNRDLEMATNKAGGHIVNTPENEGKRDEMALKVKAKCPDCMVVASENKYGVIQQTVTHPSGLWFTINTDPGVVEVQMKPLTLNDIKKNKELIQSLIFDSAAEAGIKPDHTLGAGHIHMDLKTSFLNNPQLFLNFITDYHNHPGVGGKILNEDNYNSPLFGQLGEEQRKAYEKILQDYKNNPGKSSIQSISDELMAKVYNTHIADWQPTTKYQALNVTRIVDNHFDDHEKTLEIRAIRPQRNADDFVKEAELFQERINFLSKKKELIPYKNEVFNVYQWGSDQKSLDDFYQYVLESKLDWKSYTNFLPHYYSYMEPSPFKVEECQEKNPEGPVDSLYLDTLFATP